MLDVKEFVKKLSENEDFAAALSEVASKEELLAKAKEFGFELKEEDLVTLTKALGELELGDDDLAAVSGGKFGPKSNLNSAAMNLSGKLKLNFKLTNSNSKIR